VSVSKLVVAVFLVWPAAALAGPVVTLQAPADAAGVADVVPVQASIQSDVVVASVTVSIAGVSKVHTGPTSSVSDSLDISSLPLGPVTLTVKAVDAMGGEGTATAALKHDHAPVLQVTTPEGAVARPDLPLRATCSDSDLYGCTGITVSGGVTASTTSSTLDQTVSLQAMNGHTLSVTFTATDAAGLTSTKTLTVYIDESPLLALEAAVPGAILDFDATRILFQAGSMIHLRDRATSRDTPLGPLADPGGVGYLTPAGALWPGGELRDGVVTSNTISVIGELRVAGGWAAWLAPPTASPPTDVFVRDLTAGTTTGVMTGTAGVFGVDVAENGDVVFPYWTDTSNRFVARRRGTAVTTLIHDATPWENPRTDGVNVVVSFHSSFGNHLKTEAYTASGEVVGLADSFGGAMPGDRCGEARPPADYALAGGWIAFTNPVDPSTCVRLIHTRSPAGTIGLATTLNQDAFIRGVSASGEVAYSSSVDSRTYLGSAASPSLREIVPHALGTFRAVGDQWYVMIGNSLFRVQRDAADGGAPDGPAGTDASGGAPDAGAADRTDLPVGDGAVDADVADAATSTPDAGRADGRVVEPADMGGCSCSSGGHPGRSHVAPLALLALAVLRRPRRRQSGGPATTETTRPR
jgi:MYXO-CTERM domain-containing protein